MEIFREYGIGSPTSVTVNRVLETSEALNAGPVVFVAPDQLPVPVLADYALDTPNHCLSTIESELRLFFLSHRSHPSPRLSFWTFKYRLKYFLLCLALYSSQSQYL